MDNAPERILAWIVNGWGSHWAVAPEDAAPDAVEYIRADLALALVAESYEVASLVPMERLSEGDSTAPVNIGAAIQRLTPADAQAARDARDEQVREQALREAAEICTAAKDKRNKQRNDHPDESRDVKQRWMAGALQSQYNAAAILAMIEKDQTND